jgi:uncharacterized integral membrane protein
VDGGRRLMWPLMLFIIGVAIIGGLCVIACGGNTDVD